eukprot:746034-Hanusia_phi.AAC.2
MTWNDNGEEESILSAYEHPTAGLSLQVGIEEPPLSRMSLAGRHEERPSLLMKQCTILKEQHGNTDIK